MYYSACREHPAFEDLKRVLIKTVALGDRLRETMRRLGNQVRLAFVYGSVAAGVEGIASDVDLLIVGELSSRQAARVMGPPGRELGREFNSVIYPEKESRTKVRKRNRFVREAISDPKIWLMGGNDELEELVE